MAKAKARRRANNMTIPLAVVGGLVPAAYDVLAGYRANGLDGALGHVSLVTTGYDPGDGEWKPAYALQKLYGPLALGALVHKAAGKLGINRMLASAGIPIFRI
jgi:hypothetical protein